MTPDPQPPDISTGDRRTREPDNGHLSALTRRKGVVLVMDLVESVRIMAAHEAPLIGRWRGFVQHATSDVLPRWRGRLVKSLGDGLMMEFGSAADAVAAARALHRHFDLLNPSLPADQRMYLRAGMNTAEVWADQHDIYGSGVNLAARVATLAGPGETMITAAVRDELIDGLDAELHDMGECYLKHVAEPVRVYRAGEAGARPVLDAPPADQAPLQPTLAVLPFQLRRGEAQDVVLGDLIADGVIARVTRSQSLKVLSRLSTAAFAGRAVSHAQIGAALGAHFVLTGYLLVRGEQLVYGFELASVERGEVLVADQGHGDLQDLFSRESQTCDEIAAQTIQAVIDEGLQSAVGRPMPTLASYSLYLAGVAGIHRALPRERHRGEEVLQHLVERHPRRADPAVWLAQWLTIRLNRGLSSDPLADRARATALLGKALEAEPDNPFALAVHGLDEAFIRRDFGSAERAYDQALSINPNEHLAWLYKATLLSWTDRAEEGVAAAERALALSPLHPTRYYIESLAALPFLVKGDTARAIALCQRSLRINTAHTATYRVLAAAQALHGDLDSARQSMQRMLELEPDMTVHRFLQRYAGGDSRFAPIFAAALAEAGMPR